MDTVNTQKLAFKEKLGYALGDTGANIAWRSLTSTLPFFYAKIAGIPPEAIAFILLIPRLSDGITDIIMGTIADRTNTKYGKFRPWLLWTAIPFGLLLALTFISPNFSLTGRIIWAYATYIMLTLAYTANNVPYNALLGVMTPSHTERTRLASFRFFGAFSGGALAYFLIIPFIKSYGDDNPKGYTFAFVLFAIMMAAFSIITFLTTKERIIPKKEDSIIKRSDLKDAFNNKAWLIILIVGLVFVIYNSIKQGIALFYFTHYLNKPALGFYYLGALVLISMATSVVTPYLVKTFGKKQLFILAMTFTGIFTLLLYFASANNVAYVFIVGNISEIGAAIMPILFFAMLGDIADYHKWKTKKRTTGIIFAAGTFAMKSGGAIGGALMLFILGWFGFVEGNGQQSAEAIQGIRLNMSLIPTLIIIVSIIIMFFYPLNKSKLDKIEQELKELE